MSPKGKSAKDYKQIFEGDKGPNTGGVGCFSPNILFNEDLNIEIQKQILSKIEIGFQRENLDYNGILFIGLMITKDMPKVLEFNVRFGDPETEVLIPRLESDIVDIFEKTIDGKLTKEDLIWTDKKCVTVVATSGGYPGKYEKGKEITGIDDLDDDIILFHNGTKRVDGKLYTNGGRVLSITALADTIEQSKDRIYKNIDKVYFEGMYFRKDIGKI